MVAGDFGGTLLTRCGKDVDLVACNSSVAFPARGGRVRLEVTLTEPDWS